MTSAASTASAATPRLTFQAGSRQHRMFQLAGWACFVIPMLVLPYVLPSFRVAQLAQAVGWGIAILGMNMVIGWSGLISLGHIAFTGLGAYTTTILINESRFDMWMTLPVAFVVCFLFGALVGLPALKIRGLYLALITLALALTFPILIKIEGGGIARRTGGDNGRTIKEGLKPTGWMRSLLGISGKDASSQVAIYKYFCMLIIAGICFLLVRNIMKSSPGRGMLAIRDNQIGAAVSGVPLNKHKVLTFALSAAFAGIGGSMIASSLGAIGPTLVGPEYATLTLMGLVLCGVATLHGCWLGGLAVVFLQDLAPRWIKAVPGVDIDPIFAGALFGLILVLVPFFMPRGIVQFARWLKARFVRVIPQIPRASVV